MRKLSFLVLLVTVGCAVETSDPMPPPEPVPTTTPPAARTKGLCVVDTINNCCVVCSDPRGPGCSGGGGGNCCNPCGPGNPDLLLE